jgi:hypothetical protein
MSAVSILGFTAERSLGRTNEKHFLSILSESGAGTRPSGVYPARFACWPGMCACSGDEDCNAMFSTACSSGGYGRCWIRGPGDGNVFCLCS